MIWDPTMNRKQREKKLSMEQSINNNNDNNNGMEEGSRNDFGIMQLSPHPVGSSSVYPTVVVQTREGHTVRLPSANYSPYHYDSQSHY
jgi:hypothetical protein